MLGLSALYVCLSPCGNSLNFYIYFRNIVQKCLHLLLCRVWSSNMAPYSLPGHLLSTTIWHRNLYLQNTWQFCSCRSCCSCESYTATCNIVTFFPDAANSYWRRQCQPFLEILLLPLCQRKLVTAPTILLWRLGCKWSRAMQCKCRSLFFPFKFPAIHF